MASAGSAAMGAEGLPKVGEKNVSHGDVQICICLSVYIYIYSYSYIYMDMSKMRCPFLLPKWLLKGENGHYIGRSQNEVPCSILESNILGTQKCTLYVPTERHHGIVYFRYTRLMFSGLEILEPKNHHRTSMQHFPSKHHIDPYWSILW